MLSNSLTYILSILALLSYFGYIVMLHGTVGFLVSVAIFLLLSSVLDHLEHITIGLLIIGLSLSIYVKTKGAMIGPVKEGFEETATLPVEEEKEKEPAPTKPAVAPSDTTVSTPAAPTPTPAIDVAAITKGVQEAMATIKSSKADSQGAAQDSTASKAGEADGFQEPSAGLFKLGELPSEMKKGPFVDVASTMSKAMSSLNPDQIANMTAESQSLLDTQKNLMGMLQSMKPVLQDGRQLLDTFSGIFGGLGGLGGGKVEGKLA
jgi:hypothetical protein